MASLVIIAGAGEGTRFPLTEPLVSIGRDDTCTFQVLDKLVSRKHLQVRVDPTHGKHVAADYRSAHGVFINGKQIVLDTVLSNGDKIKIGETLLIYVAADHPDAESAYTAAKKMGEWQRSTIMRPE